MASEESFADAVGYFKEIGHNQEIKETLYYLQIAHLTKNTNDKTCGRPRALLGYGPSGGVSYGLFWLKHQFDL